MSAQLQTEVEQARKQALLQQQKVEAMTLQHEEFGKALSAKEDALSSQEAIVKAYGDRVEELEAKISAKEEELERCVDFLNQ